MVHKNLKKIRIAKGVTQAHLAKKLDISKMAYSRMENGESKIDVERLLVIATALSIEVEVFFDEKLTDSVINSMEQKHAAV